MFVISVSLRTSKNYFFYFQISLNNCTYVTDDLWLMHRWLASYALTDCTSMHSSKIWQFSVRLWSQQLTVARRKWRQCEQNVQPWYRRRPHLNLHVMIWRSVVSSLSTGERAGNTRTLYGGCLNVAVSKQSFLRKKKLIFWHFFEKNWRINRQIIIPVHCMVRLSDCSNNETVDTKRKNRDFSKNNFMEHLKKLKNIHEKTGRYLLARMYIVWLR